MIPVGLRVDVDTLRGTRIGVPRLLDLLAHEGIHASFFFSVGPDNMGRHLRRLANPFFALKMVRTRAASLYGWDILFKGILWPGPLIGKRCAAVIRDTDGAGHEVGLHAWDHHGWQCRASGWDEDHAAAAIARGFETLGDILGHPPVAAAAPAWRVTGDILAARERFGFRYLSDCRGYSVFRPRFSGGEATVQVPTTLPAYDEVVGRIITPGRYNAWLLDKIRPDRLNVLTVHAEAEGIACADLFVDFLHRARDRGIVFFPLGEFVERAVPEAGMIKTGRMAGRAGWVAIQAKNPNVNRMDTER